MAVASKKSAKIAKKDTHHPDLKIVTITDTTGEQHQILSTYGSDTMKLEVDPYTHPAWRKDGSLFISRSKDSKVSMFEKTCGDLFSDAK